MAASGHGLVFTALLVTREHLCVLCSIHKKTNKTRTLYSSPNRRLPHIASKVDHAKCPAFSYAKPQRRYPVPYAHLNSRTAKNNTTTNALQLPRTILGKAP